MKYNSKKFYLFLSVLRVLILIILLNHMKIVFSKMAYLYLFIEYIVKMGDRTYDLFCNYISTIVYKSKLYI